MSEGTKIANAYVQILPSTKDMKKNLTSAMKGDVTSSGEEAGGMFGGALTGKLKGILAAVGVGKILADSINEGAALQQSIGGIETLFKDSADTMIAYANDAWKTAGISANSYMEQSTSFAAALLSSTEGDTAKAAEAANQAIIDMADNSNKFGSSLESIQTAYQGFSKQNYTMLDNLKLGYGGTKSEMERLLADAEKLSGVEYNIENLADVYQAIHVIQDSLDVTGTTAKEASTTFTGSMMAMKSSLTNFLGQLSTGGDVGSALGNLIEATGTFLFKNAIPMIANVVSSLPGALASALNNNVGGFMEQGLTVLLDMVNGFVDGLPQFIETISGMLHTLADFLVKNAPSIIENGAKIVSNIATGIIKNLPTIIKDGVSLIGSLAKGIIQAIPTLIKTIPQMFKQISSAIKGLDWKSIGKNIVDGIKQGIKDFASLVVQAAKDVASSALQGIKNILGIHSPSRVFKNEVGKMIDLGLAEGINGNINRVESAMDGLASVTASKMGAFGLPSYEASRAYMENATGLDTVLGLLNQYLPSMGNQQIILDTGVLVGQTAPKMDKALGGLATRNSRGVLL